MAFIVDPATELRRAFNTRMANTIVGLTTGAKVLTPGLKVRIASALKKIAGVLEKQAREEIGVTDRRPTKRDAGVLFALVPKSQEWVIDEKACAQLFPRAKYPKAWRQSNKGGNVSTDIGPLGDE